MSSNRHVGVLTALILLLSAFVAGCEQPGNVETAQQGYRGTGMVELYNTEILSAAEGMNAVPEALPASPGGGPLAKDIYQNVQVLTDLDVGQFTRVMTAMTNWVSPEEGCAFCHGADGDNASDALYQKVVSRRMLEMTREINANWKDHVRETGVTCWTCHRGQNVPANVWYEPPHGTTRTALGNRAGQNTPSAQVGVTSLPVDPLSAYLTGDAEIPVVGRTAIGSGSDGASIIDTERTYAFMVYITKSLGVNCTSCHNTRSFFAWDQSRPQRVPAWHGIRLARDLNNNYLLPLKGTLPANRLGRAGDVPKIGCATCHQGAAKPLNGVSMLADYPELARPAPPPAPAAPAEGENVEGEPSAEELQTALREIHSPERGG